MNKMLRLSLNIAITVLIIISALLQSNAVSAADTTEEITIGDVSDPGILPDSGFYFMKSWGRNLQMTFAGSDIKRARLMLKFTNEDALALQEMYEKGKYDVGAKHAEKYALQLQKTVQAMEQVRTRQGENASEYLVDKLEQNYLRQQEVLLSVLEKAPGADQEGLLNAIENSNKHVGAIIMAQQGQQALQQYQEQVNQQTKNMGQETKIRVQQRLQITHGQAGQPSDANSEQGVMNQQTTQSQTQTKTQMGNNMQQTTQQSGQPNSPNQGNGPSNSSNQGGESLGNQYGK
jgi:hypothetical protein